MRAAAVIGLAYLSGSRRAELVALHLADIEIGPAAIGVPRLRKQRLVPLSPTVEPRLEA
jgi:integrase